MTARPTPERLARIRASWKRNEDVCLNVGELLAEIDALTVERNHACTLQEVAEEALRDHRCGLPSSIIDALNSGDGTYRP